MGEPARRSIVRTVFGWGLAVVGVIGALSAGMLTTSSAPPISFAPDRLETGSRPPLGVVRMKRERLIFEQTHGLLLERAEAFGEDWRKIEAAYEHAANNHPKSVLLDIIGIYPGVIHKAGEDKDGYDALVPRL